MVNYFDELKEKAKTANTIGGLEEINKIGKRTLNEIISDPNMKNSLKKSSKKKYKSLKKEIIKRRRKIIQSS